MPPNNHRTSSFSPPRRFFLPLAFLLLLLSMSGQSSAVAPPDEATRSADPADPLRCWWRTGSGAVRSGETFDLTLTCAALDSPSLQAVVDESRLAGSTLALAPFDIVSSAHPRDLRNPHNAQRRFFQYRYTLRLINPDAIGKDVALPPITLNYRIDSRTTSGEIVEGRALNYLLPPLSVRILSLVPANASGIRDMPDADFFSAETLERRAGILEVLASTLAALGGLLLIALLSRGFSRRHRTLDHAARLLDTRQLLAASQRELAAVARAASAEWHDDLATRAQAAIRIAAACALDRTINQTPATSASPDAGQLVVTHAREKLALSAAVTGEQLAEAIAALPRDASHQAMLAQLHEALITFDRAQYGADNTLDRATLDSAIASALAVITALKAARPHAAPWWRRLSPTVAGVARA